MPAVSCIASPNPDPIPVRPTIIKQCYSKNDCNAAVVVVVIVVMVVVRTVVVVVVRSILSAVPRVVSSPADRQGSPGLLSARLCLRAWSLLCKKEKGIHPGIRRSIHRTL